MAYSELIKSFGGIRDYLREFYVYGLKSRDEFRGKSGRSYDDERRRAESWLNDFTGSKSSKRGKNVFITIDSRLSGRNPLFRAWKAKSFTDSDIALHFIILDILHSPEIKLPLSEITEKVDTYLPDTDEWRLDESTVRRKLKEYIAEGIISAEKRGRAYVYSRTGTAPALDGDMLSFFSETAPCGVIGSFLLDKAESPAHLSFKHHYLASALDSEVLCDLLTAMRARRCVIINGSRQHSKPRKCVPLRIMISAGSGRQYLMCRFMSTGRIASIRIDNIVSVKPVEVCPEFDGYRKALQAMQPHIWGVSTQSETGERMQTVEFTIRYRDDEAFIPQRLEREKRCGSVEYPDANTARFYAEVYDAGEMIPWIRTFIRRIVSIHFSNPELEYKFRNDLEDMYEMYGISGVKGGERDDIF